MTRTLFSERAPVSFLHLGPPRPPRSFLSARGFVTRYADSMTLSTFSRMRGGTVSITSSVASSRTTLSGSQPLHLRRRHAGAARLRRIVRQTHHQHLRARRHAPRISRAYLGRRDGSMATSAPLSHTASIAGPPSAAKRIDSSPKPMLIRAPTRVLQVEVRVRVRARPLDHLSYPHLGSSSLPRQAASPSGRGSGDARRLKRSPPMTAMFPAVWTRLTLPAQAACAPGARSAASGWGRPLVEEGAGGVGVHLDAIHSVAARREPEQSTDFPHRGTKTRLDVSGGEVTPSPSRAVLWRTRVVASRGATRWHRAPTGRSTCRAPWRASTSAPRWGDPPRDAIQPDRGVAPGSYPKRGDGVAEGGKASVGSAPASPATPATATPPARSLGHRRAGEASVAPSGAAALPVGLASEVAREVVNFLRGRARTRAPSSPPSPRRRNRPRSPNHSPREETPTTCRRARSSGRRAGDRPFPRRPR